MVVITFSNREIAKQAVGFLLGRFSGRLLKSGECLVPGAALEALALRNLEFTVKGKATLRLLLPEQATRIVRGEREPGSKRRL